MLREANSDRWPLRVTKFMKLGRGELVLHAVKKFDHDSIWRQEALDLLHCRHGEELGLVKDELCGVQSHRNVPVVEFARDELTPENLLWPQVRKDELHAVSLRNSIL